MPPIERQASAYSTEVTKVKERPDTGPTAQSQDSAGSFLRERKTWNTGQKGCAGFQLGKETGAA